MIHPSHNHEIMPPPRTVSPADSASLPPIPPTDGAEASWNAMLEELTAGRAWFGRSSIRERLQLVTKCLETVYDNARQWVDLACEIKQIDLQSSARAEEMVTGPVAVLRYLEILAQSLKDISATGCPRLPGSFKRTPAGSLRLPVVPVKGLYDALIFPFHQGEIRMQPDVTPETLAEHLAYTYRQRHADSARLAVVLGAGNVTSIPVADVLTKMFRDNCVVLLKLHPVTAPLEETFRRALSPLVERDLLRITTGDQRFGEAVIHDPRVDTVHITGSHRTYQAIVWGSNANKPSEKPHQPLVTFAGTAVAGQDGAELDQPRHGDGRAVASNEAGVRRETERRLNKKVTAELGNVSPWIVVPGRYSSRDLNQQAECLAQSIVNNVSFNCVATKVIVTWRQWKQRDAFLDEVERIVSHVPRRVAWYPGAVEHFGRSLGIKPDNEGRLPWTFLRNVAWDQPASFFQEEFFGCVFADVAIDADDERQFVRRAFDFANDRLFGSLAATLTVPNAYRRADATGRFFQEELDRLRYQAVGINVWPGLMFVLMSHPWGSYGFRHGRKVESGVGLVHDGFMVNGTEKTTLEAPLQYLLKPFSYPTYPRPQVPAEELLRVYHRPNLWNLGRLAAAAVRGSVGSQAGRSDKSEGPQDNLLNITGPRGEGFSVSSPTIVRKFGKL